MWKYCLASLMVVLAGLIQGTEAQIPAFQTEEIKDDDGELMTVPFFDMFEDDRGFIWLATMHGLRKYDGTSVSLFEHQPGKKGSIVPGHIGILAKSRRAGGLWLGSNEMGVSYWDIPSEQALNFLPEPNDPGSLISGEIGGLVEDADGGLWVGTGKFTLHYLSVSGNLSEQNTFRRIKPPLPPNAPPAFGNEDMLGKIICDRFDNNKLWIGCRYGVYHFNRKTEIFTFFPFDKPIEKTSFSPKNVSLLQDNQGRIWCGGLNSGVLKLDPKSGLWRHLSKPASEIYDAVDNTIYNFEMLDSQQVLACTGTGELWAFDVNTDSLHVQVVSTEGRARHDVLFFIRRARSGMLWAGMITKLMRLSPKEGYWHYVSFSKINKNIRRHNWQRSRALSPDRQWLYMGTLKGDGLLRWHLRENRLECFPTRLKIPADETDLLMSALCFDDHKRLWIGTENGLWFWEEGWPLLKKYTFNQTDSLPFSQNTWISSLCLDRDILWIGTKGKGLYYLNIRTNQWGQFAILPNSDQNFNINTLLKDDRGRMWVAFDAGLAAFESTITAGRPTLLKNWHFKRQAGQLSGTETYDLQIDAAGHLWISTIGGGLNRLRGADPENPQFDYYFNDNQQGGNMLYGIAIPPKGRIWMGSMIGMCALDTTTKVFTNYTVSDGLFPKPGKLLFLPDGRLVSGANYGFHLFYPDSVLLRDLAPKVYFKNLKVFDEEIPLPKIIDQIDTLTLNYNQNHFSIEFGALNFGFNERSQFAYILEGYQSDWVYSGTRNYVSYTNLPPGTYRLRVKAANKHGLWSETEKMICLVITPPFWQTGWFIAAIMLLILCLGKFLYETWRNRLKAKEARAVIQYFSTANYAKASVKDIIWDLTYNCIARLGFEDCVVYLLDSSGEFLVQEAAYGAKSPQFNMLYYPLQIPLGKGIVGAVALNRKAEIIPDTRKDERYIIDDKAHLSEIAVPIIHGNRAIGVIDSEHSRLAFFTPFHLSILKAIALLISEKIASAQNQEVVLEKETQLADLNRHLAESQLSALRAQMNPHFLFNSLNSINWYILKNKPKEASLYLTKFSKLIRMILDHSKEQYISLEQELQALKFYVEMEAIRFEQEFKFSLHLDPDLDLQEIKVPPLILQPFVENAIWHGLIPKGAPGRLDVTLKEEGDFLYCCIEDNGIGRAAAEAAKGASVKQRESKGVLITRERLKRSGHENPVEISDLQDETGHAAGTKVEIWIQLN